MLNISNLHVVFNKGTINEKHALKGVNLTINDGDFITVIGGNGAGKSTLLNSIAGSIAVEEGSIVLGEENITKLPDYKRAKYISRVFQDPLIGTAGGMSIEENLALAARRGKRRTLKWYTNNEEREVFKQLLAEFDLGLEDRMMQKVGTLSGGQRQAITLLMASMANPKLLLLDEHTAALAPKTALKVLTLTEKIAKANNLTVLMITHNMSDAIKYGNKLIMMNDGNIVFSSEGEEKQQLTIPALMEKFENTVGEKLGGDKLLLGN